MKSRDKRAARKLKKQLRESYNAPQKRHSEQWLKELETRARFEAESG